jgi:hydroxyacylglutathione hydrolase
MEISIHSFQMGLSYAHLLATEAGLYLVDAGSPGREHIVLEQMRALGREDLKLIFITHAHFDHYGSAAELQRKTGAPIAIHEADAAVMARGETLLGSVRGRGKIARIFLPLVQGFLGPEPVKADIEVKDGEDLAPWGLRANVIHTPGHTPGSCCLWVDDRYLFAGDLLSSRGRPHAQRYYATDWSQIVQSLERIKALGPTWTYSGHGARPLSREEVNRLEPPIP